MRQLGERDDMAPAQHGEVRAKIGDRVKGRLDALVGAVLDDAMIGQDPDAAVDRAPIADPAPDLRGQARDHRDPAAARA
jgi:hypothetical protein